jgi:SAM-dependent methyltransferase
MNLIHKIKRRLAVRSHSLSKVSFEQQELKNQIALLKGMADYYFYEISSLRSKVRLLASEQKPEPFIAETKESFDYQWTEINSGKHLLDDEAFRKNVKNLILQFTDLQEDWFKDKKILDAGCGQGRFSYGFAQLGSNLTALDQSAQAVKNTQSVVSPISSNAVVQQQDLLLPTNLNPDFDLVWSYGVLHHTGDTYKAFKNIVTLVKPNGYIFLMLYGEPQLNNLPSFLEQYEYSRLRHITANMSFKEKIELLLAEKPKDQLHGWFDAISPAINDTYSLEEIKTWLIAEGFGNIKVTSPSTNHHIVAQKSRS